MWRSLQSEIFARKNAYKHFWLEGPLLHTENISLSHHYYHLFNSVKRRARISFWKLFSLASVYIKKKITMLTRILASSVRTIPWTLGSPFLSFFYNGGGILCACDGLTKIHKSYKKRYNYIYNIHRFNLYFNDWKLNIYMLKNKGDLAYY